MCGFFVLLLLVVGCDVGVVGVVVVVGECALCVFGTRERVFSVPTRRPFGAVGGGWGEAGGIRGCPGPHLFCLFDILTLRSAR